MADSMNRFVDPDDVLARVLAAAGGPPLVLTTRASDGEAVYVGLDENDAVVEVAPSANR